MQNTYVAQPGLPDNSQLILNNSSHATIINISEYTTISNWSTLKNVANLEMIIARSSVGEVIDKQFHEHFRSMKTENFAQLAIYHQFLGGDDAPSPTKQFESVTKALGEAGFERHKDLFAIALETSK